MQSLASASQLLARCNSVENAAPLLAELGFTSTPVPLTQQSAALLALPETTRNVRIAVGKGPLRVLVFSVSDEIRAVVQTVASILGARTPELLFLLVAIDCRRNKVGIAVFDATRVRACVSALLVEQTNIVDSDAETVCALAAARSASGTLTYTRWLDILGRDSINRRFFRELERVVTALSSSLGQSVDRRSADELALICISRLLFLSFLETKGWLDRDHGFLGNRFAECMVSGGSYHRRVLTPLFFGTLNTHPSKRAKRAKDFGRIPFLNGGLFARAPVEARYPSDSFSDDSLGDVFGSLLTRYRFTAREDGTAWTEAAIDPEMLGKAFESLMSSAERKKNGAFYTPQSLVREVCHSALSYGLATPDIPADEVASALSGSIPERFRREALLKSAATARVLDPACGSGAFLVHLMEELAALRVRLGELQAPHVIRREILTRSIFGVDLSPMAVWLCELRLWLSMAIEDPESDPLRVTALPNLDRNIRIGDSLSGAAFSDRLPKTEAGRSVIRSRYARATGPRKRALGRALDAMERRCAIVVAEKLLERLGHERRELIMMIRSPDLFGSRANPSTETRARLVSLRREIVEQRRTLRELQNGGAFPFSFAGSFADVSVEGGFRIIAGNPPWVRAGNLDLQQRTSLRERYSVYRNASWQSGATIAAAGKGFSSQIDAAALFVERCTYLVQPAGAVSLIVPAKLWRSLAGGGVRRLITDRMELREIHDLTSAPNLFDAAVYPSVVTVTLGARDGDECLPVRVSTQSGDNAARWSQQARSLSFDESPGSPWIIAPPEVRASFDAFRNAGAPLAHSPLGRPLLGVKTGCNDAFIVGHDSDVEPTMLRRVVKGDQVRAWSLPTLTERIIWTHDETGPVRLLPPNALRALSPWRRKLERRADCRHCQRWWMLFRTESASCMGPRVVWCDIGKTPRAAVIPAGDDAVPLNTCYVARCEDEIDAHSLATLLNSRPIAAWLSLLAEPARGGYLRFLGWTMSLLPVPKDWARARRILGPIGIAAKAGACPDPDELSRSVLDSYRLSHGEVSALLEWNR